MTNSSNTELLELESAIVFFHTQFSKKGATHFDLLGLAKTATQKELEAAYQKYSQEFSPQRIAQLTDPETRKKGDFLITRGQLAFNVLTDFKKRAEYEKRGFRDEIPPEEIEEDTEETAKALYKRAKSLKTMKDYPKCIKVMEEAIRLDPEKPAYYLLLGLAQTQIPEYKRKAEQNLQKAADMESWNAEPFAAMGMLFYSERLFKRAESYFRKALELEQDHALAKAKLAEIAGPEKKPIDAVQKQLKKFLPSLFGKKK
ncbi:MAG: tetratricopeptide repeat protein [bacterium]|nr:tetratricopeptide repeat protein [bacterium]